MNDIETKYFLAFVSELNPGKSIEELVNENSVDLDNGWYHCGGCYGVEEIIAQFRYKIYIADFCIGVLDGKDIIVEIDGQETHKTKEQRYKDAEKGRFFVKNGYIVIRFTASEVYVDARSCVKETLEIAWIEHSRARRQEHFFENRLLDYIRDVINRKSSKKACAEFVDEFISDRKKNGITEFFED